MLMVKERQDLALVNFVSSRRRRCIPCQKLPSLRTIRAMTSALVRCCVPSLLCAMYVVAECRGLGKKREATSQQLPLLMSTLAYNTRTLQIDSAGIWSIVTHSMSLYSQASQIMSFDVWAQYNHLNGTDRIFGACGIQVYNLLSQSCSRCSTRSY